MKFIVIGGDERFVRLCRLLQRDGHGVFPLALDSALPVQGPPDFAGADAVILPLPAERGGFLNAPLSGENYRLAEVLAGVPEGKSIFAGMAGEGLRDFCGRRGLRLRDYFAREELQVKNAALTAEGALGLLLGHDGGGLCRRRILICGFGRIGRLLAPRLLAMGARVGVAARSASDRAWAEAMGCAAMSLGEAAVPDWDFVVNTVPSPLFGGAEIAAFGEAKLVELASAPYGFDLASAEALGKRVELASGLPARCAPEAAAAAIRDTIYNMLEE